LKQKLVDGNEVDCVYCRHLYNWKPGTIKKIKRALNKRLRKEGKDESLRII